LICLLETRLRACLKIERGPAAADFAGGPLNFQTGS
jgi:hypothetical protein